MVRSGKELDTALGRDLRPPCSGRNRSFAHAIRGSGTADELGDVANFLWRTD